MTPPELATWKCSLIFMQAKVIGKCMNKIIFKISALCCSDILAIFQYNNVRSRSRISGKGVHVVCGRVPWQYQYWPGGFLCSGAPEGSTSSGSGFKASQKTEQRLKDSSDRLGEAGNQTCDPCFTRHGIIPCTTVGHVFKGVAIRFADFISIFLISLRPNHFFSFS